MSSCRCDIHEAGVREDERAETEYDECGEDGEGVLHGDGGESVLKLLGGC
jgi:hypothetical protein